MKSEMLQVLLAMLPRKVVLSGLLAMFSLAAAYFLAPRLVEHVERIRLEREQLARDLRDAEGNVATAERAFRESLVARTHVYIRFKSIRDELQDLRLTLAAEEVGLQAAIEDEERAEDLLGGVQSCAGRPHYTSADLSAAYRQIESLDTQRNNWEQAATCLRRTMEEEMIPDSLRLRNVGVAARESHDYIFDMCEGGEVERILASAIIDPNRSEVILTARESLAIIERDIEYLTSRLQDEYRDRNAVIEAIRCTENNLRRSEGQVENDLRIVVQQRLNKQQTVNQLREEYEDLQRKISELDQREQIIISSISSACENLRNTVSEMREIRGEFGANDVNYLAAGRCVISRGQT